MLKNACILGVVFSLLWYSKGFLQVKESQPSGLTSLAPNQINVWQKALYSTEEKESVRLSAALTLWNLQSTIPVPDLLLLEAVLAHALWGESLMVIGGLAPAGSIRGFNPVVLEDLLNRLKKENVIRNSDLGWFPIIFGEFKEKELIGPFKTPYDFIIYSRKSVKKLLGDTKIRRLLQTLGFVDVFSEEQFILEFKDYMLRVMANEKEIRGRDIVYGIMMGYPLKDVLAYSDRLGKSDEIQQSSTGRFTTHPLFLTAGAYGTQSPDSPVVKGIELRGDQIVTIFLRLLQQNYTYLDIVNQGRELICENIFSTSVN